MTSLFTREVMSWLNSALKRAVLVGIAVVPEVIRVDGREGPEVAARGEEDALAVVRIVGQRHHERGSTSSAQRRTDRVDAAASWSARYAACKRPACRPRVATEAARR